MSYQKVHSGSLINFKKKITELTKGSKVFVICDSNTEMCFKKIKGIVIPSNTLSLTLNAGEENKNLNQVIKVWDFLNLNNANKNDWIINIGGGVICDLGGFAASTFKRGVSFINIPTSLLGMVDAAIGGKTGFNFKNFKNNIGSFSPANMVFCDADFLETLPNDELKSGFAEVIKHALISDLNFWNQIKNKSFKDYNFQKIISQSIEHKLKIVESDPKENGPRKKLNFGHTIGHALESYFLSTNKTLLHGFAVAQGMVIESYISFRLNYLNEENYMEIKRFIHSIYPSKKINKDEITSIVKFMKSDKKNENLKINFTLLNSIGNAIFDEYIATEEVQQLMLDFYKND